MPDALRRAIRTFIQAFLGSILTSGVLSAAATDGIVDLAVLQKIGVSSVAAAVIATLTYVQNVLEDNGTVPALLKAPASSGMDPAPEDAS